MPQKLIRKVDLNVNSLITNTIGSSGELLQDVGPSSLNHNLANHIVENNLNGNAGSPFPNKIESLFDNVNNTQVRIVGHPNDEGVRLTATVGNPNDGDVTATGRRGFFIFDLGRKVNPRKFQMILDGTTRFILDSECLVPNNPPDKGVRLKFTNDLTNFAGGVQTAYKDNGNIATGDDFTDVTVAAGVAPHTEITTGGVTSIKGDTNSFDQRVLTLDENFFKTDYDGYRFFIVEIRGSRYSYTFDIFDISLFEEVDPRIYNVEFDDSVLDLSGWKNPRYAGSKLTGQKINEFNKGDTSYGKNPVVENKTTALYIVDSCIGAEQEDESLAFIEGHSYLKIKQILVINENDDSIQVIDRESEDFEVFQRFITNDFPTGANFKVRIIDDAIQNNLKPNYFVKFNKGFLFSSFEYVPVTSEEVKQRTAIVKNKNNYGGTSGIEPDFQSGEGNGLNNQNGTILNVNVEEEAPIGVFDSSDVEFGKNLNSTVPNFGTQQIGPNFFFENGVFDSLSLHKVLGANNGPNHNINAFPTLDNSASRFNLMFRYGTFVGGSSTSTQILINNISTNNYDQTGFIPGSDNAQYLRHNFYPDYSKSFVRRNKFTERYIPGAAKKNALANSVRFELFESEEVTDATFNPDRTDIGGFQVMNGAVPEIISASIDFAAKNNIEMHLTINNGNIDCAPGFNDERSITTFEVETFNFQTTASITNFVQSEINHGKERYDSATQPPFWGTVTDFQIVLKPNFLPTIPTFRDIFSANIVGTHSSNNFASIQGLRTKKTVELRNVYLRGNQGFFSDFGALKKIPRIYGTKVFKEVEFGTPTNDPDLRKYDGNFNYTLSFLDKGPTIIADINKDNELFDGIGEKGLLLVPKQLEIGIRDNIDFYLRKAGIIEKRTIKAPSRPERGR